MSNQHCISCSKKIVKQTCGFFCKVVAESTFNTDCKCFTCKGHHCDTCKEAITKKQLYQKCLNCQQQER